MKSIMSGESHDECHEAPNTLRFITSPWGLLSAEARLNLLAGKPETCILRASKHAAFALIKCKPHARVREVCSTSRKVSGLKDLAVSGTATSHRPRAAAGRL